MALTRDLIRSGWIQSMVATSGLPIKALTEEELQRSRAAALARHPQGEDLALFAYGSLIWNPAFHFVRREVAAVRGLHRRFCLWTQLGRGSPDNPGLVLGLDRGGSCRGVVYWIAAEEIEGELDVVWRREMVTGAYRPTWVTARTVGGPPVPAITFAINREHERYAGQLGDDAIVTTLATACGPLGACADYLFNTTVHLDELGITDPALHRLCRAVRERQRELSLPGAPHSRASDAAGGAGAA
jgi:cation transport protein ChaC